MADTVTLTNDLSSVGVRCVGLPWSTDRNPKMETDRADKDRSRIQVVDYLYTSPNLPHTKFLRYRPYSYFQCLNNQNKQLNYNICF